MKTLLIAPRFMLPADTGGKIRTYNLIKQIAKFTELYVVCFSFEQQDRDFFSEFERMGVKLTLIPAPRAPFFKKMIMALDSLPYSVAKYGSPEMAKTISVLVDKHQFNLVHVDHVHLARYHRCFPGLPCLLDEHNVEHRILERCGNVETAWVKRFLYFQQASKMKRFEAAVVPHFSACTAVSDEDAEELQELAGGAVPVHVLPNGVDTEFFSPDFERLPAPEEDAVAFTGSMDWLPNEDTVFYFVKEILPLIWRENPKVKFYVVGKDPSLALREIGQDEPRIVVTGRVEDVRPFLAKSKVCVIPLRIGGGTRIKILEAMAMEKAIIATSIGAEGIGYTEDKNIMIADHPQEFARKVLLLLSAPQRRTALGTAGRQLVLENYDWSILGRQLKQIYEGIGHG